MSADRREYGPVGNLDAITKDTPATAARRPTPHTTLARLWSIPSPSVPVGCVLVDADAGTPTLGQAKRRDYIAWDGRWCRIAEATSLNDWVTIRIEGHPKPIEGWADTTAKLARDYSELLAAQVGGYA
ncbi:hypothetical protein KGQ19_08950 [Catenulispora sp. NL8]|uniref:Uncharacterized protein n=1 Tax=Catenulispora pinistramenti TaxID=2705254 RepID=A0ABS5KLT8_9ACTN|nr:hypothetical protein [Catenulispora pinistramenti]MBS2546996.1 hypothetical protein [Catenulispora pinistramenti]